MMDLWNSDSFWCRLRHCCAGIKPNPYAIYLISCFLKIHIIIILSYKATWVDFCVITGHNYMYFKYYVQFDCTFVLMMCFEYLFPRCVCVIQAMYNVHWWYQLCGLGSEWWVILLCPDSPSLRNSIPTNFLSFSMYNICSIETVYSTTKTEPNEMLLQVWQIEKLIYWFLY